MPLEEMEATSGLGTDTGAMRLLLPLLPLSILFQKVFALSKEGIEAEGVVDGLAGADLASEVPGSACGGVEVAVREEGADALVEAELSSVEAGLDLAEEEDAKRLGLAFRNDVVGGGKGFSLVMLDWSCWRAALRGPVVMHVGYEKLREYFCDVLPRLGWGFCWADSV